jgi:hypothetical protein
MGCKAAARTRDNGSVHDTRNDLAGIVAAFHVDHWASETGISASTQIYDASKFSPGYRKKENRAKGCSTYITIRLGFHLPGE